MIAMKGPDGEAELADAARAISLLGGRSGTAKRLTLPPAPAPGEETALRLLLLIDKMEPTPSAYPRPTPKIAKKSL